MKEIIIIAGENKFNVAWLRSCLRDEGYSSISCETVEEIIEELKTLPICGVYVPLVLIEPELLKNISDEVLNRLRECCLLYTSPSPRDRTRSRMPSSA